MQVLPETLYTVSAEFDVGIIGQENRKPNAYTLGILSFFEEQYQYEQG